MTNTIPLVISIEGFPKVGKTTLANQAIRPFHLDMARVNMGFRELSTGNLTPVGDAYHTIARRVEKLHPGEEVDSYYSYITDFSQIMDTVDSLDKSKFKTIVIDDTYNFRGLRAIQYCKDNDIEWPSTQEWGLITQDLKKVINNILSKFPFLILINRMGVGENNVSYTQYYPSDILFSCDLALRINIVNRKRTVDVVANRFKDIAGDDWIETVSSPDMLTVFAECLPESFWRDYVNDFKG